MSRLFSEDIQLEMTRRHVSEAFTSMQDAHAQALTEEGLVKVLRLRRTLAAQALNEHVAGVLYTDAQLTLPALREAVQTWTSQAKTFLEADAACAQAAVTLHEHAEQEVVSEPAEVTEARIYVAGLAHAAELVEAKKVPVELPVDVDKMSPKKRESLIKRIASALKRKPDVMRMLRSKHGWKGEVTDFIKRKGLKYTLGAMAAAFVGGFLGRQVLDAISEGTEPGKERLDEAGDSMRALMRTTKQIEKAAKQNEKLHAKVYRSLSSRNEQAVAYAREMQDRWAKATAQVTNLLAKAKAEAQKEYADNPTKLKAALAMVDKLGNKQRELAQAHETYWKVREAEIKRFGVKELAQLDKLFAKNQALFDMERKLGAGALAPKKSNTWKYIGLASLVLLGGLSLGAYLAGKAFFTTAGVATAKLAVGKSVTSMGSQAKKLFTVREAYEQATQELGLSEEHVVNALFEAVGTLEIDKIN